MLSVLLGLACLVHLGGANSAGIGVPCTTVLPSYPKLGHIDRGGLDGLEGIEKKNAKHELDENGYKMWWTKPPVFKGDWYTVRTGDGSKADDPTSYTPGMYMDVYVRTLKEGKKFQGLIMYAVDKDGETVGEWETLPSQPFIYRADSSGAWCLSHANGEYKSYLNVFRFKAPPKGTGDITFLALVKEGLAFPVMDGHFFWPNEAHLKLTEHTAAAPKQVWFKGEAGQSCTQVCAAAGGTCTEALLLSTGYDQRALLAAVKPFYPCAPPMLGGCSATSPALGTEGCFFHRADCDVTRSPTTTYVRPDPCEGVAGVQNNRVPAKACRVMQYVRQSSNGSPTERSRREGYNKQYWQNNRGLRVKLCNSFDSDQSLNGADSYQDGNGIRIDSMCKPPGGFPTAQPTTAQPTMFAPRPSAAAACDATHADPRDGQRLCPCGGNASPTTQPPSAPSTSRPTRRPSTPMPTAATPTAEPSTARPTMSGVTMEPTKMEDSRTCAIKGKTLLPRYCYEVRPRTAENCANSYIFLEDEYRACVWVPDKNGCRANNQCPGVPPDQEEGGEDQDGGENQEGGETGDGAEPPLLGGCPLAAPGLVWLLLSFGLVLL